MTDAERFWHTAEGEEALNTIGWGCLFILVALLGFVAMGVWTVQEIVAHWE